MGIKKATAYLQWQFWEFVSKHKGGVKIVAYVCIALYELEYVLIFFLAPVCFLAEPHDGIVEDNKARRCHSRREDGTPSSKDFGKACPCDEDEMRQHWQYVVTDACAHTPLLAKPVRTAKQGDDKEQHE